MSSPFTRSLGFLARHLKLSLVVLILGTVVLSAVLTGRWKQPNGSAVGVGEPQPNTEAVAINQKPNIEQPNVETANVAETGVEKPRLSRARVEKPNVKVDQVSPLPAAGKKTAEEVLVEREPSLNGPMRANSATNKARATSTNGQKDSQQNGDLQKGDLVTSHSDFEAREGARPNSRPKEERLIRARSFNGDIRKLRHRQSVSKENRAPKVKVEPNPRFYPGPADTNLTASVTPKAPDQITPAPAVTAPAANIVFEGLDRENWGAGSPPDTTGDVGPTYYIQAVNTSVGIYRKSDGFREAAFTFDTLMSQGNFGNLCDTNNFGDPVVLYDTFEDRWVLTDFAFILDGGGNAITPAYQCFAVSKTGDPLTGGWNFYSIHSPDFLNDYPKLGVWTDGIYMSANMFTFGPGGTFQTVRVWALNKAQMYAGSPTVKVVSFNVGAGDFTLAPSNARLQTGTPPPGRPNMFISTWNFLNAVGVYKFHVDWESISLSSFTGPEIPIAATSWPNAAVANIPQPGTATLLDSLQFRAMVQNQYTNFGGTESLWIPHTVRRAAGGFAAPRWYQVNTTGGTVNLTIPQAATWDPDAANVIHRFMPSLALDRGGNLAMGYTTSSTTQFPSLRYAGRLSTDPVNTFGQTEQVLFAGTASQTTSTRWGDYSSMMLDPDGCTFWYTNEYANPVSQDFDKRWLTKIASFKFAECTPVGAGGTLTGTVTATVGGAPINGATIEFGARTTTTDAFGVYSFLNIPAGTYPSISASFPGYVTATASNILVIDGDTTTQNFSLDTAATAACLTDTTTADFQAGVPSGVDLTANEIKLQATVIDQQNTTIGTQGAGTTATTWLGQTFTPAITAPVNRIDLNLFSLNCSAVTMPSLTVSIRNAAGNLPTGADLATGTIPGFCNGAGGLFTATLAVPVTLTAGTQYALVLRPSAAIPVVVPAAGYFWSVSVGTGAVALQNPYAGGRRASSATSGATWAGAAGNANNDHGFKVFIDPRYMAPGNFVSSPKDANPAVGFVAKWTTLSWTATTPANTTLQFQVAASNDVNSAPNFVGPDGTAATFFTISGASISQFNGLRYLRYKAFLATADNAVTPVVSDVTACFSNTPVTPTISAGGPTTFCAGGSVTLTSSSPVGNQWYLDGNPIGGATAQQFVATESGNYTVTVTINGATSDPSLATTVTVNPIPATPTISPVSPAYFCAGGDVTLTSSSASGNQWYLNGNPIGGATNQTFAANLAGDYTVIVTSAAGCPSAPSVATSVAANTAPVLTYSSPQSVALNGSLDVNPSTASDNGPVTYQVLAGHGLTTAPTVDAAGVVSITNAQPSGAHLITIRVTDACLVQTDASFTLNVVPPDMTVTKTHVGTFVQGQVGATYTITVTNSGSQTTAPVTVTDTLPVGLTPTEPNGAHNGWACSISSQTLTCTRADVLAGNSSYPTITVTVNVANPAPLNVTNTATVAGGGEIDSSNNSSSDLTAIQCTGGPTNTSALMISEFRLNGPGGPTDEFIEIFNPSSVPHTVGSGTCTGGYGVFASAGNGVTSNTVTLVCAIPNGTVIPAGGHVLCTNTGYSLATQGSNPSTTGGVAWPSITAGVATAVGNFPIVNGSPGQPGAFSGIDIPNDAGLILANIGLNTITASSNTANGSFGFGATGVSPGAFVVFDRVGFAPYGSGAPLQPCQLANPAGCGASGSARPSLADNFCEGGVSGCLRPVGDASTSSHGTSVFYGDSGQYSLVRRQTTLTAGGTAEQDTHINLDDFLMVAPLPSINIAFTITNFLTGAGDGLVSVLGAAGPQNNAAPADLAETALQSSLFDPSRTSAQLPNAERRYVIDSTNTSFANNPQGSLILRFGFRNMSAADLNRLRFRVDNLSVPCGQASPAAATAVVGSGNARNLSQTSPNCQGADNKTAVLKMLNLATEFVAPENGAPATVRGSVIEDTDGTKLAPNGGGINNSLVRTGIATGDLTGELTTVVPGGAPGPKFYVGFRMGVVKGGSFRFLFQPEGSSATPIPWPTVP